MKAIILAAGRGSRMKNLTEDRPKCLVELRGKSLLEWQITALQQAGVSEIGIVTGYKRELLAYKGLSEFHNPRWAETQMVSSLACASKWLLEEPCIVSYSDIFYGSSAVSSLMEYSGLLAVTYDPNWLDLWTRRFDNPLVDAETFNINESGFLLEIGNKPKSIEEVHGQYMGLLRFTPEGWGEVVRTRTALSEIERDKIHMTATLQQVIQAKRIPIKAIPYSGEWGEVDSTDDLAKYHIKCDKPSPESFLPTNIQNQ